MTTEQTEQTKLWAKSESERLDQERQQRMKDKGYRDFFNWKKGENRFEIVLHEPTREIEGKYGKQIIFAAKSEGMIYDLAINVKSPAYRIVVNGLAESKTKFNILKSGEGKETKYELLEATI
jgi:hypothetical protein